MFIAAAGLVCSVGLKSATACAAMRAGVAGFTELPYLDNAGVPIIGAAAPGLDPAQGRQARLRDLLVRAADDCLGQWRPPAGRMPLLLGVAETARPGGETDGPALRRDLEAHIDVRFDPARSRVIPEGHTSGFVALGTARELLRSGAVEACLVGGVDSYLNARSLLWLDRAFRLKTLANSDGVIPGEAAAVLLLRREASGAERIELTGLGFAQEAAHVLSGEPLLGIGLAAAVRTALAEAGVGMHEVDVRLADVTGEQYGFKEIALALTRTMRQRRQEMPLWHAADALGDVGAAAGPCQAVVAWQAFRGGYAPGQLALCHGAAVSGQRAAAVLRHRAA